MRKAAKRRLDAAEHDGHVLVRATDEVAIDHVRVVGAQAHLAAGGVEVLGAPVLGNGVVVDHRVHVAAAYEKRQARLAQDGDARRVAPVWLRDDAHLVAVGLEHARDDGAGKGGVVDVGVAAHVHEVALVPAARGHVLARDGEKRRAVRAAVCRAVLAAVIWAAVPRAVRAAVCRVPLAAVRRERPLAAALVVRLRAVVPVLTRPALLLVHVPSSLCRNSTSVVEGQLKRPRT